MANFPIKMNILNSMGELLKTVPLAKLPVSRICEEAGISHSSFYRYFSDKYAVGIWYITYAYHNGVDKIGRTYSWHEGFYKTTSIIHEHFAFFEADFEGAYDNIIREFAPDHIREAYSNTITDFLGCELTEQLKLQIEATIAMELDLAPKWHRGKFNITMDQFTHWLAEMVPHELHELLNHPAENR